MVPERRSVPQGIPSVIETDPCPSSNETNLDDDIGSSITRGFHDISSRSEFVDMAVAPAPRSIVNSDTTMILDGVLEYMTTVDASPVLPDNHGKYSGPEQDMLVNIQL